jgi:hypothetical protein
VVNDQLPDQNGLVKETKQQRRDRRRAREKTKMLHHGKSLAKVYKDAVSKRARTTKSRHRSS